MDGTKCSFRGCSCHDFLPFVCPRCEAPYCLDHRSRFTHDCFQSEDESALTGSIDPNFVDAANAIGAVESRFDASNYGSNAEHIRIKTAAIPTGSLVKPAAQERINKLDSLSKSTTKDSTRRVSQKTKEILIKSHAIGNDSIHVDDRIYFTLLFSSDDERKLHHYFKKSSSLGEIVNYIANNQPQLCFSAAVRPENQTAALFTEDSPDWKMWNRSTPISDLLDDFEQVFIVAVSIEEAVQAQRICEELEAAAKSSLAAATAATAAAVEQSSVVAGNGGGTSSAPSEKFIAGEVVEYQHKLTDESGKETVELVTIVGVHHDDFPNIYYTIKYNANNREKQTDANRLRRIPGGSSTSTSSRLLSGSSSGKGGSSGAAAVAVAGAALTLKLSHGARHFEINQQIGEQNTISQLKEVVSRVTGVAPKSQKLIFKGSTLKDLQTLKASKLLNGSKISMIGS